MTDAGKGPAAQAHTAMGCPFSALTSKRFSSEEDDASRRPLPAAVEGAVGGSVTNEFRRSMHSWTTQGTPSTGHPLKYIEIPSRPRTSVDHQHDLRQTLRNQVTVEYKPERSSSSQISAGGVSLWTFQQGWRKRPRPLTTAGYRSLGHRTASSGRRVNEAMRPSSTFVSRTERYSATELNTHEAGVRPSHTLIATRSPDPEFMPCDNSVKKFTVRDKGFGGNPKRFTAPAVCGSGTILTPSLKLVQPSLKGVKVGSSRSLRGSIYEDAFASSSPGLAHSGMGPPRCLSTVVFPTRNVVFAHPSYADEIKTRMRERVYTIDGRRNSKVEIEEWIASKQNENVEDELSVKSASSQSLYHSQQQGYSLGGPDWQTVFVNCQRVAAYAGKRLAAA